MRFSANPYDELPYKSFSIEWSAPERLALASLLHGGPRPPLEKYRVLELGCGNGANLLALAYYRRHAAFVGVDAALSVRFGLDRGEPRTLEEVGEHFNLTRERIRQIEARAMSKLRHPSSDTGARDLLAV